jgi:TolA-binding protein
MKVPPLSMPRTALLLPLLVGPAVFGGETAPAAATAPLPAGKVSSALPISPDELESLLKLAGSLTDRSDFDAAEIAYFQILRSPQTPPPQLKVALLGLGRMYRRQGSLTKAVAVYERFLKDNPLDERAPDALLDLGRTLRALGLHKGAITRFYSVLNSTLKVSGGNFEHYQLLARTAQFEIAQTHFEAGEFADAAKFFTRLRLLDLAATDRARAHFMSAYSLRLQGDLATASTTLRAFIDQSPADENVPEARYLLAVTLRELGRPHEALAATLELLQTEKARTAQDPKRWAYWQRRTGNHLANELYESGDTLNALALYEGLQALSPEPAWRLPVLYQIALCAERLGSLDRARTALQQVIAGGEAGGADMAELVKLSRWRLEHLAWRENVDRQVASQLTIRSPASATNAAPAAATVPAATPASPSPAAASAPAATGTHSTQ